MAVRQSFGKSLGTGLRKGRALCAATALLVGLGCAQRTQAQSLPYLEAFQGLYAENGGPTGPFTSLSGSGGANSAQNPFTGSASFTGLDSQGQQQTMTLTGSAYSSATYGAIHVYGAATITNPYYNAANQPYVGQDGVVNTNGSPDTLGVHGNAGWGDTFTYLGLQGTGYKVNYYFHLDGNVTSDAAAGLNFHTSDPGSPYYSPRTTLGEALWITPDYKVTWGTPFNVFVDFFGGTTSDLRQRPEGVTFSATGDYSNTLTLAGIQIKDAQGVPVSGWTLASASGTSYSLSQSAAVPEQGSAALFCSLGVVVIVVASRQRSGSRRAAGV